MNNHQLINQTSGSTEWYTPHEIMEAVHEVMGGIDLDPASSEKANSIVKAARYFTRPELVPCGEFDGLPFMTQGGGGLDESWAKVNGRIWLNAPFGRTEQGCKPGCKKKICVERGWHTAVDLPGIGEWLQKLDMSYQRGDMAQAMAITFASPSESWFHWIASYPICLMRKRVNYLSPDTLEPVRGATKGSVVVYLGANVHRFSRVFGRFGPVYQRMY
jgi:hypothetical protein